MTTKNAVKEKKATVKTNHKLDKLSTKVLFPKKVALAQELLDKAVLPTELA
jgi:hypothetical protein